MKKIFRKFLASAILAPIIFGPLLLAQPAYAQIPGVPQPVIDAGAISSINAGNGILAAIAASTAATVVAIGPPGASQGLIAGILAGSKAVGVACDGVAKFQEIAGTADNFSSPSLIGGSPGEALQITTKLAALIAVRACDDAQLEVIKNAPAANLLIGQELARKQGVLNSEINSLSIRIEALKARQSASFSDVLKAIAVKLLLTYSQKLATNLINALIAKYKISNYLQYANAVGGLVYTADYVKNNYSSNSDQLILRSILQNQLVQSTVMPMVRQEAEKNLGYDLSQLTVTDPDFYTKMAMAGSAQANPYFLQTSYGSQALNARTHGQEAGVQETSQSTGFVPVRNCTGAVSEQKQIDLQLQQASSQADINYIALQKVKAAYQLNKTPQQKTQLDQAQAAYDISEAKINAMPNQVSQPFVTLCSAISSPGSFVGNGIQNFLKAHLDQAMNLNNANLPFYGQFLQSVAVSLVNNLLTGGKNTDKILTEAGISAANIVTNDAVVKYDANQLQNQVNQSTHDQTLLLVQASKNGATFQANLLPGSTTQFQLLWDTGGYITDSDLGFVTVTSSVLPTSASGQALAATGGINVNYPASTVGATYTLNIYAKGDIPNATLPLDSINIVVRKGMTPSASQQVAGAFTAQPVIVQARGTLAAFDPRGE